MKKINVFEFFERKRKALLEGLSLFHGSPYDFDSFRGDKEGTGSGAQGFGWGMYFTDSEEFAKSYASEDMSGVSVYINGKALSKAVNNYLIPVFKSHGNKPSTLLAFLQSNAEKMYTSGEIAEKEFNLIMGAEKLKVKPAGILYQVDVGGANNFLEWRKPITDSHTNLIVRQMQKSGYKGRVSFENGKWYKDIGGKEEISKGGDIYRAFAGDVGFDQKKASMFLSEAGIDGIRYEDSGKNQYVIFDPASIKVVKKTVF